MRGFRSASGFTLVELLVTLIVGSVLIGSIASTFVFTLRGMSSLGHYSDMKYQADRFIAFFENDARDAAELEFYTPSSDEVVQFDFVDDAGAAIAGYILEEDPSPPESVDSSRTWYRVTRVTPTPVEVPVLRGIDATDVFEFRGGTGHVFDVTTSGGRSQAEGGTTSIFVNVTVKRGREGSNVVTHEVSSLVLLSKDY